ncbi:chemotaxis protein CheB [Streptomyces venezuelae]|uniref:chemotaxis protein CheB n=1 Tax=Streptomyces venezuelae TaxID=54571 RepID=UPI0037879142
MSDSPHGEAPERAEVVLVAASAGGIGALTALLGGLSASLPVPVLAAQHLRRSRETAIASILSRATPLEVKLAEHGESLRAGTVYVAPPDHHLCVRSPKELSLSKAGPVNFTRPAADPLFESAVRAFGPRIIACVLTGTDSDGALGVAEVKAHGGTVIVQDPASAEFRGMPKAAVDTGFADFVLGLADIAPTINRLLRAP